MTKTERFEQALREIADWGRAYPLSVFPEPDIARAHKVLTEHGMTVDAISASAIRHAVKRIIETAEAALAPPDEPEDPDIDW